MRVLVVDDSILLRCLYSKYLSKMGHDTIDADQTDAEHLDWGRFDVVLLDVMMPRLAGYDLLRIASKTWSSKPIVIVYSVMTVATSRRAFVDAGVDGLVAHYISKSSGVTKSLASVEELLGNSSSRAKHESEQFVGVV